MVNHKSKENEDKAVCDVDGCNNEAVRSESMSKVKELFKFKDKNVKMVHLCREHYKEYKKETKEERKLDHLRWAH